MLEKRGLVARLLHRRPAVWYDFSWHDGIPKLEQREHGWYDYNYVMDRDGQVLFQIRDKRWIIRGVKMNRAQTKRQIEQQISEMKARESKPTTRVSTEDVSARDTLYKKECTRVEKAISSSLPGMNSRKSECYYLVDWPINDIICLESR